MDLFSQPPEHTSDFLGVDKIREYRQDGSLVYLEDRAIISNDKAHLYSNRVVNDEGISTMRIGRCAKYHSNGQLAWELNYDSMGNVVKDNKPHYREDGTIIQY